MSGVVKTGLPLEREDVLLCLTNPQGIAEERYFVISYSPIFDRKDAGMI